MEAACALSALLAADLGGDFCRDMLEAAPLLIAHLSGGMGIATAEQSAWILGEPSAENERMAATALPYCMQKSVSLIAV